MAQLMTEVVPGAAAGLPVGERPFGAPVEIINCHDAAYVALGVAYVAAARAGEFAHDAAQVVKDHVTATARVVAGSYGESAKPQDDRVKFGRVVTIAGVGVAALLGSKFLKD